MHVEVVIKNAILPARELISNRGITLAHSNYKHR